MSERCEFQLRRWGQPYALWGESAAAVRDEAARHLRTSWRWLRLLGWSVGVDPNRGGVPAETVVGDDP